MSRHSTKLRVGRLVFIEQFQTIGKIVQIMKMRPDNWVIKVDHYLIGKTLNHNTEETEFIILHRKPERHRYEAFEIYDHLTRELEKRKAFTQSTGHPLKRINMTRIKNVTPQRMGLLINYCITQYDHNPKNLQSYPGTTVPNPCRQNYWIVPEQTEEQRTQASYR